MQQPTIGRIVIYKSKIDNGLGNDVLSPAIVIRTRWSRGSPWGRWRWPRCAAPAPTARRRPARWCPGRPANFVAELPDDDTVDLLVFGLGKSYREYAVGKGDGRGQWSWPPRV